MLITLIVINIVFLIFYLLGCKFTLSKIYINEENIEWKIFKKQLKIINWNQIKHFEKTNENRSQCLKLTLTDNQNFLFNFNKKKLKKMVEICPSEELKIKLKEIKMFR